MAAAANGTRSSEFMQGAGREVQSSQALMYLNVGLPIHVSGPPAGFPEAAGTRRVHGEVGNCRGGFPGGDMYERSAGLSPWTLVLAMIAIGGGSSYHSTSVPPVRVLRDQLLQLLWTKGRGGEGA